MSVLASKVDNVAGQRRRPTHTDSGHLPTYSRGSGERPAPSPGSPFSLLQGHRGRGLSAARAGVGAGLPNRAGGGAASAAPAGRTLQSCSNTTLRPGSCGPFSPPSPRCQRPREGTSTGGQRTRGSPRRAGKGSGPRLRRRDPTLGRCRARSPAPLPSASQAPPREAAPTPRLAPQPRPPPRAPSCLTCALPSLPPRRPRAPRRGTRPPGRR